MDAHQKKEHKMVAVWCLSRTVIDRTPRNFWASFRACSTVRLPCRPRVFRFTRPSTCFSTMKDFAPPLVTRRPNPCKRLGWICRPGRCQGGALYRQSSWLFAQVGAPLEFVRKSLVSSCRHYVDKIGQILVDFFKQPQTTIFRNASQGTVL